MVSIGGLVIMGELTGGIPNFLKGNSDMNHPAATEMKQKENNGTLTLEEWENFLSSIEVTGPYDNFLSWRENLKNKHKENIEVFCGIDEAKGEDRGIISWAEEDNPSDVSTEDEDTLVKKDLEELFEQVKKHREQREKDILNIFKVSKEYLYPNKEDDENMDYAPTEARDPNMWTLFDVIMVDKENLEKVVDDTVIAKDAKQARGKAGVEDILAKNDYDETKFVTKIALITNIRPVKDDE